MPRKNAPGTIPPGTAAPGTGTGPLNTTSTAKGGAAGGGDGDAFISRLTSGMTFDFSSRDERIYIAGVCGCVRACAC